MKLKILTSLTTIYVTVLMGLVVFLIFALDHFSANFEEPATAVPASRILLEEMMFDPEDLGWPSKASRLYDEDPDTEETHSDFLEIVAYPYEGSASRRRYGAYQSIWEYPTNQAALDFYDYFYELEPSTSFLPPIEFEPKTRNVSTNCQYADRSGGFYNCDIIIQVGSYFSLASMDIDGEEITFQDWEQFVNIVQDKFIKYASPSIEQN